MGSERVRPALGTRRTARLYGPIWLVAGERAGWQPGIGDPTFAGWFTTLAYFGAAWACWRAARHTRLQSSAPTRLYGAWLALFAVMLGLGLNKQLDLQSLFIETARNVALAQGWYDDRRALLGLFLKALAGGGVLLGLAVAFVLRREVRHLWLALLGCGLLGVFMVVRAASFSHVDAFGVLAGRLRWGLELGGIALVALAAYRHTRPTAHDSP